MDKKVWIAILVLLLVADIFVFSLSTNRDVSEEEGKIEVFESVTKNLPLLIGGVSVLAILIIIFLIMRQNV